MSTASPPASTSSPHPSATSATSPFALSKSSSSADRIACEDTRQTQKLLNHYAITTPTISYHQHNERQTAPPNSSKNSNPAPASPSSPTQACPASAIPAHGSSTQPSPPASPSSPFPEPTPPSARWSPPASPTKSFTSSASCPKKPAPAAPAWKLSPPASRLRADPHLLRSPASHRRHPRRYRIRLRPHSPRRRRPRTHQAPRRIPPRHRRRSPRSTCISRSHPRRIRSSHRSARHGCPRSLAFGDRGIDLRPDQPPPIRIQPRRERSPQASRPRIRQIQKRALPRTPARTRQTQIVPSPYFPSPYVPCFTAVALSFRNVTVHFFPSASYVTVRFPSVFGSSVWIFCPTASRVCSSFIPCFGW